MINLQEVFTKTLSIFKDSFWFFVILSLISSILCIYILPIFLNNILSEQAINDEIGSMYGGLTVFSADQIILSLTLVFQFSIVSIVLLIAAYKVKYIIDKRIFSINKWRDWKFFIYISGISVIILYLFQAMNVGFQDNLISNFILTFIYCFIVVIFSIILLPEEQSKFLDYK